MNHILTIEDRSVAEFTLRRACRDLKDSLRYDLGCDNASLAQRSSLLSKMEELHSRVFGVFSSDDEQTILQAVQIVGMDDLMSAKDLEERRLNHIAKVSQLSFPSSESVYADKFAASIDYSKLSGKELIIDMDDTLISNSVFFSRSAEALIDLAVELNSELSRDVCQQQLTHIDKGLLASYGFTPRRWYESARSFVHWATESNEFEHLALDAADLAFDLGEFLPGVERTLTCLKENSVSMVLKTKGDIAKQSEKLEAHNMERFFDNNIIVLDRKNVDSFLFVASRYNFTKPVSIGDSAASDIQPALEAGMNAIYIDKSLAGFHSDQSPETFDDNVNAPHVASFVEAVSMLASV